ncbi:MAG: Fur family transcriptional regulator [Deltaproteobacteria bacterium]
MARGATLAESPDELLQRFLAERGLKSTRQRSLIVNTFLGGTGGHLDVDELLRRVRESDPKVSAATVYRTMKLLTECGLAHAQRFGDGHTRYESAFNREHHDHLICTSCGAIVEFENDRIEALQDAVARRHGFAVTRHKLELYGLCRECQPARSASRARA